MVRRGAGAWALYGACKLLLRALAILLFDIRIFDARRTQRRGPVVLASNHQSFLDPALLGISLRQRSFYMARDTLFRIPLFRQFITGLNAIPIPRGSAASRRGIDLARAVLRAGKSLILFPEGTRTRDGRMGPVKRGVELIARPTGAGVIPAFIDGSFDAWPPGGWLRPHPVRIFFGDPLEAGASRADERGGGGDPRTPAGKDGSCADLTARLTASFRRLEARSRRVRRAGAARSSGWPHFFG